MRKLFALIILAGMVGFGVPASFSQQRQPAKKKTARVQQVASRDIEADIQQARHSLEQAKNQLAGAGQEWGGHRVNAIKHIDEALAELTGAEKWARAHKDIK